VKRFRFRLERVQRVRVIEEEVARAALQAAEAQAREAAARVEGALADIEGARAELRALVGGGTVDPAAVLWRQSLIDGLRRRLEVARRHADQLERKAARERELWQHAAREREALERLAERRRADHLVAAERRANIELDEIAGVRAAARRHPDTPEPAGDDS
jgi:flagellar export protein FliJ